MAVSTPTTAQDPVPTPTARPVPAPIPTISPADGPLKISRYIDQDFRLEIFTYALNLSPVRSTLELDGPYTLLAARDAAWVAADTATIQSIFSSIESLAFFNRSLIISGDFSPAELVAAGTVSGLNGRVWTVTQDDQGRTLVGNARVIATVTTPANGTVHILDALIR